MRAKINFRRAFLHYLLTPSGYHKKELFKACNALYNSIEHQGLGADEGNDKVSDCVEKEIIDLYITKEQIDKIQSLLNELAIKDKEKSIKIDTVLSAVTSILEDKHRIISDEYYKIFSSIYPIELDGYRIIKEDPKAGNAALNLSKKLIGITLNICNRNNFDENDKKQYAEAYAAAKNQGIEKHRGLKQKFQNFCIAVSCIFVFPVFIYSSRDSFWSTTKTKTQQDIENSEKEVDNFIGSFQNK